MSLSEIRNVVLLFSNPVWSGGSTVPTTIIRNISSSSSQLAYEERLKSNITTLTTTNADTLNGVIQGLLYVPDIRNNPACNSEQYDFLPRNVTRKNDLPPANYNLIAFAPWFSIECTEAYLASARRDPIRAFIFYKPNNSSNKPQDVDSPVWNLDDNGLWRRMNPFPIFAVSGQEGQKITTKLSHYSGNITETPHGDKIQEVYRSNPRDYVRIWTELEMERHSNGPALWAYFLIVIGALLLIFTSVSLTMHVVQRRRRSSLRRRVESGEVDLEAMGIKRVTVPAEHVKSFPLFTYQSEPDLMSAPPTPMGPAGGPMAPRSARSSRRQRRADPPMSDAASQFGGRSVRSLRSKRSSVAASVDTTATNDQPKCQICLDTFEHRTSIIREMACGHIFHPECIDEYLIKNSSLCPICMQNMLPAGYSPKITNAMVRRERNLRRLRQRVHVDDASSLESGNTKMHKFKRLFRSSSSDDPAPEPQSLPLTPVQKPNVPHETTDTRQTPIPEEDSPESTDSHKPPSTPSNDGVTGASRPNPPQAAKSAKPRTRKTKPRALNLLPTQPEESELKSTQAAGRKSPSSFARQRMREIAHRNAPFDDPDRQPRWRVAVNKVFPGLT